jgi:hypothetical protein
MRGGKQLADRGVIPRMLSAIYRRARKIEKDSAGSSHVDVIMSYYEIYNDKVFDLFEAPEKRGSAGLALRDNGGKTVVVGLTERPCESLKEFEKLYDQANVNRSTSATKVSSSCASFIRILICSSTHIPRDLTRFSASKSASLRVRQPEQAQRQQLILLDRKITEGRTMEKTEWSSLQASTRAYLFWRNASKQSARNKREYHIVSQK